MKIINNNHYFTNRQINKLLNMLDNNYKPKQIIIYDNRLDLFRNSIKLCALNTLLFNIFPILFGKIEGQYSRALDTVCIYIFSQNDDGENKQSKQLYSIHALMHELRHVYQCKCCLKISEEDADKFATYFVNSKSNEIKQIMKWKREWSVEEE